MGAQAAGFSKTLLSVAYGVVLTNDTLIFTALTEDKYSSNLRERYVVFQYIDLLRRTSSLQCKVYQH